jgi:diaminopimelate decarboxylase
MNRPTPVEFDWAPGVIEAASRFGTPCYLFSWREALEALRLLASLDRGVPIRHWVSMKTQPLRQLLKACRALGLGIEVVSEFELRAALNEGFSPESILVNGVAKHNWLRNISVHGLRVHFDSLEEVQQLASVAASLSWRVGIRFAVKGQFDPDDPSFTTQFGMSHAEARDAVQKLRAFGNEPESVHFHLRSNVAGPNEYAHALEDMLHGCDEAKLRPRFLDCGGGLPCAGDDQQHDASARFDLGGFADALLLAAKNFKTIEEIWLENGRFLTGRAGVLVLRVIDVKERPECRYLICDGGRTNHALVSDWERHAIFSIPSRSGPARLTTICGPTCMAYDRLARIELPTDLSINDLLVWKNAGAYHIPWETRFSHGLAPIVWMDEEGQLTLERGRESFTAWWNVGR